ncbi:hypothetical protein NLO93_27860, partial [Pseudomonas savastanoi]|uniref:hypothetical protein n=3 Tax=Pseudomonas savastanoi TaxID=29438 RepID=UPI00210CDCD5
GLLALAGILGVGEGHLFHHRKARRLVSGDFAKLGSLFQSFLKSGIDKLYQAGAESQQANLARNYAQNNIGGLGITRPSRETAKRLGAKIEKSNKIHSGALDEEMKEIRFVENYRRREAAGFGNGRKKRELVGVPHSGGRFDQ